MKLQAWRLPWKDQWVPHGLLDILRGCNLTCRACYNNSANRHKSLQELREELRIFRSQRRLDALGIVGGEPLLHPQLEQIVRMIKSAGIAVEIFTNGLLLDAGRLAELKAAGTDAIFLHIDAQQDRPDLPTPSAQALHDLRTAKARIIAEAGMEAGLAVTAYPDAPDQIDAAVQFVLYSPHVDYLLVTLCRDTRNIGQLMGDLHNGIRGKIPNSKATPAMTNQFIFDYMQEHFALLPFAFLGSNTDCDDPRWLTYVLGAIVRDGQPAIWSQLKASAIERIFLRTFRLLHGRYPFYLRQSPGRFRLQLLLNALSGGLLRKNLALLTRSFGRSLKTKRLLFQSPAELAPDGKLIHCSHCPDATVRHGRLVPVCISDQVAGANL